VFSAQSQVAEIKHASNVSNVWIWFVV
jgi:hypothetical protein